MVLQNVGMKKVFIVHSYDMPEKIKFFRLRFADQIPYSEQGLFMSVNTPTPPFLICPMYEVPLHQHFRL